jgi:branched-chain amino acid transport system substrate-binding protein
MLKILLVFGNQDNIAKRIMANDIVSHRIAGTKRFLIQIKILEKPTIDRFFEVIRNGFFDVIIIVGHSRANTDGLDGTITINDKKEILENRISIERFTGPFTVSVKNGLKLVILAGCSGDAAAAKLVSSSINVPNVIAFRLPIHENVLRQFFGELFRHWIKDTENLEMALSSTRKYLKLHNEDCPGAETIPIMLSSSKAVRKPPLMFHKLSKLSSRGKALEVMIDTPAINMVLKVISIVIDIFNTLLCGSNRWIIRAAISKPKQTNKKPSSQFWTRPHKNIFLVGCFAIALTLSLSTLYLQIEESTGNRVLFKNKLYISDQLYLEDKEKIASLYQDAHLNKFDQTKIQLVIDRIKKIEQSYRKDDPELIWTMNNAEAEKSTQSSPNDLITIPITTSIDNGYTTAREALRGAVIAQEEINKQGTPNKHLRIRLNVINDNNDVWKGLQVAGKLALEKYTKKYLAVIGHFDSDVSLNNAWIYQLNKLVRISSASTVTTLNEAGDFIFRTVSSSDQLAEKLANRIKNDQGNNTVGFCSDGKITAAKTFQNALEKHLGKDHLYAPASCNVNSEQWTGDSTPAIIGDIKKNAQSLILYFHLNYDYQIKEVKTLAREASGNLRLYGSHSLDASNIRESSNIFENIVIVTPRLQSNKLAQEFTCKFHKVYGSNYEPTWRDMMAYDAVKAIAYGLDIASNNTSENLKEILHRPNFSTPGSSGNIRFNKSNGDRFVSPSIASLKCQNSSCRFELENAKLETSPSSSINPCK